MESAGEVVGSSVATYVRRLTSDSNADLSCVATVGDSEEPGPVDGEPAASPLQNTSGAWPWSGTAPDSLDLADIEARLRDSQSALCKVRCRVSGTMLLMAVVLGFACPALEFAGNIDSKSNWGPPLSGLAWLLTAACLVLLAMAPLADDVLLTRLVLVGQTIVLGSDLADAIYSLLRTWQEGGGHPDICSHRGARVSAAYCLGRVCVACAYTLVDVIFILCATAAVFHKTPSKVQHGMWRSLVIFFCIQWLIDVSLTFVTATTLAEWNGPLWFLPGNILGTSVALFPSLRQSMQDRVRRSVEARGATAAAAGIASLVGRCDPAEVLGQAATRFRHVPINLIEKVDFADNKPNPALIQHTQRAKLWNCDAFISHSWHDDTNLKWNALQSWRREFVKSMGQEPTVWVDKWCIDQRNIQADLRCLPIFLSGCRRLVVLCGTTYLSRLWCVIELFTFVKMGGRPEQIDFVPLPRGGHANEDIEAAQQEVQGFDARLCECFDSKDKENMMVIIHTAFGSLEAFNVAVRAILDRAVFLGRDRSEAQLGRVIGAIATSELSDEGDSCV
mmetsp:Transcript_87147/g.211426  ORF Transcript_87147/g.211426 Transcript_87147/m.211426 type:complete len:561 (+) Transcript_87147:43-1725(+)